MWTDRQTLMIAIPFGRIGRGVKITVVNNLALAPLIYVSSIIDTPIEAIHEIEKYVNDFIWNGKKPKIARSVLEERIENGGMKLCNFKIKVQALKLSWVKRLVSSKNGHWIQTAKFYYNTNDLNLYFRTKQKQLSPKSNVPRFYRDIHNLWMTMYSHPPNNAREVQSEALWDNMYITSNSNCLNWKEWKKCGITEVCDLLDERGNFYDHVQMSVKYNIKCNFLNILQIRQSLPHSWRELLNNCCKRYPKERNITVVIRDKKKDVSECKCKDYYWNLLSANTKEPACKKSWAKLFPLLTSLDKHQWGNIFKIPFETTRETYIQSFQYKLTNRIIACNEWLYMLKIIDEDTCKYCQNVDSLIHFFIWCAKCKQFWNYFLRWWNRLSPIKIDTDFNVLEEIFIFGIPRRNNDIIHVLNFCLLYAKHYIYRQKLFDDNNVDFFKFLITLKNKIKIEEIICIKENRPDKFERFNFIYENL